MVYKASDLTGYERRGARGAATDRHIFIITLRKQVGAALEKHLRGVGPRRLNHRRADAFFR
jgi:hypothetical protein